MARCHNERATNEIDQNQPHRHSADVAGVGQLGDKGDSRVRVVSHQYHRVHKLANVEHKKPVEGHHSRAAFLSKHRWILHLFEVWHVATVELQAKVEYNNKDCDHHQQSQRCLGVTNLRPHQLWSWDRATARLVRLQICPVLNDIINAIFILIQFIGGAIGIERWNLCSCHPRSETRQNTNYPNQVVRHEHCNDGDAQFLEQKGHAKAEDADENPEPIGVCRSHSSHIDEVR
mmetsp:Transcript_22567/g.52591  ORF Transcript_22567/g.52591 Transcript_22567/m.52591 type:complete len:232 (+) Transcript_22567:1245-1940(+)